MKHRNILSFIPVALACTTIAIAQSAQAPAQPAKSPAAAPATPATPAAPIAPPAAPAAAPAPAALPKFPAVVFEGAKPSAQELLTRHITATGGEKAWEAKTMISSKGSIEIPAAGLKGAMDMQAMAPDSIAIVMDIPGMGQSRSGFNGTVGWTIDPMRGPSLMDAKQIADLKRDGNFRRDLDLMRKPGNSEVLGLVEFETRPCWQVKIATATPDATPTNNFYDKETGLMAGMTMMAATPMGSIPVTLLTSEYKDFADVKLPVRTTTKVMGQMQVMTIESVTWEGVPATAFELPPEIAAMKNAAPAPAAPAAPAAPTAPAAPATPATK
jgi:hypothetical protein